MNLLRKPSCGTRLCLRRQGRLANRRPLRHPRLAASATGGASAAMPDTLRAPRLHPQSLRKKRDKQTLVSLFWQGQKDLNPRHAVLETAALPTELYPYLKFCLFIIALFGRVVNGFFGKVVEKGAGSGGESGELPGAARIFSTRFSRVLKIHRLFIKSAKILHSPGLE